LPAKTVRILPTALAGAGAQSDLTKTGRLLVSNAVDRALCNGLSSASIYGAKICKRVLQTSSVETK
jgi:hypothetical protein